MAIHCVVNYRRLTKVWSELRVTIISIERINVTRTMMYVRFSQDKVSNSAYQTRETHFPMATFCTDNR